MDVPNKKWRDFRHYDRLEAAYLFCDMEPQDSSKPTPAVVQKMKKKLELHVDTYIETGIDEVEPSESIKDDPFSVFLREDLKAFAEEYGYSPRFLMEEAILLQQGQETGGQGLLDNPLLSYLDIDHPMHSEELRIAIDAWTAVLEDNPDKPKKGSRKGMIEAWLNENHKDLTKEAKKRIATLVNPDKNGGCPSLDKKTCPPHKAI